MMRVAGDKMLLGFSTSASPAGVATCYCIMAGAALLLLIDAPEMLLKLAGVRACEVLAFLAGYDLLTFLIRVSITLFLTSALLVGVGLAEA